MKVIDSTRVGVYSQRAHHAEERTRNISPPSEESVEEEDVQAGPSAETDAVKVSVGGAIAGGKFRRIDSDSDGALSLEELESMRDANQAAGRKTKFIDYVIENYSRLDANQDAKLTLAEVHPNMVAHLRNRLRHGVEDGPAEGSEGEGSTVAPVDEQPVTPATEPSGPVATADPVPVTDPALGISDPIAVTDPALGEVVDPEGTAVPVGISGDAATAVPPTGEEIAAAIGLPETVTLEQLLAPPADGSIGDT